MKTLAKLILTLSVGLILNQTGTAQSQSIYLGVGINSIRGEVTDKGLFDEDYGLDYSLRYLQPLSDERFVLTGEASFSSANLYRTFSNEERTKIFLNDFSQTYVGVGLRWVFNNEVNKYRPYQGQILPFVGISMGAVSTTRDITVDDNLPRFFKTEPKDPAGGYEFHEGNTVEFNGQVEGGVTVVITPMLSISASGAARPGFSDTWDGITGTGSGNDWIVRTNIGVQYAL